MTLSDFQTEDGLFTIAPFDHRGSLATSLKLDLKNEVDQETFLYLKHLFMKTLSPYVSAVLTDPDSGLKTLDDKSSDCGLFLSLEESGYTADHDSMTVLKENWGIDGVKSYNAGAKLLVYFNPESETAQKKLHMVAALASEARSKGVILLVEPLLYSLEDKELWAKEGDEQWINEHLSMCEKIAPFCDILKIAYPGSEDACSSITRIHPNWVLLSRGSSYDVFAPLLETSVKHGCRGFAAGRAVWQELISLPKTEWESFLSTTAVDRLGMLTTLLKQQVSTH
jgi:tagatose-1,6-bisphosphate aldolase